MICLVIYTAFQIKGRINFVSC